MHAWTHGANARIFFLFLHSQNSLLGNLAFHDPLPTPCKLLLSPFPGDIYIPEKLVTASEQTGSSVSVMAALSSTCHRSEVSEVGAGNSFWNGMWLCDGWGRGD